MSSNLAIQTMEEEDDGEEPSKNLRSLPLWPGLVDSLEDFGGMQIPGRLKNALSERGIIEPCGIQSVVLPNLIAGENVIIHAPTGGGKTLAYLLPLLARLQPTIHIGMQILVLVPTPELALQVTRELRWLVEVLCGPERACWFNPHVPRELACEVLLSRSSLWDAIRQDTAILVSTPSLILAELIALEWQSKKFAETLAYFMGSNINAIVMDEVDAMFPAGNPSKAEKKQKHGAVERVVDYVFGVVRQRYRNRAVQLVCASATAHAPKVHRTLERMLALKWPKRRDIGRRQVPILLQHDARASGVVRDRGQTKGPRTVIVPTTIRHFTACLERDDMGERFSLARLNLAATIATKLEGTVLIFVPEDVKLDAMILVLREAGLEHAFKLRSVIGLNEQLDRTQEADDMLSDPEKVRQRGAHPRRQDSTRAEFAIKRSQDLADTLARGESRILVAKADTARGVDIQDVRYVLLLRLPTRASEYQHLAGRTGRMGREGAVISIATSKERDSGVLSLESTLQIHFDTWDMEAGQVVKRLPVAAAGQGREAALGNAEEDEDDWEEEGSQLLEEKDKREVRTAVEGVAAARQEERHGKPEEQEALPEDAEESEVHEQHQPRQELQALQAERRLRRRPAQLKLWQQIAERRGRGSKMGRTSS